MMEVRWPKRTNTNLYSNGTVSPSPRRGTVKFASQKHKSFAFSGQGKEFYSPLVIVNIGLLNISHEDESAETKEHAVPLQRDSQVV